MTGELCLRNRQRTRSVDLRLLRRIARTVLVNFLPPQQVELCIQLVAAPEMIKLNETFLGHAGSTDVITFDCSDPKFRFASGPPQLETRNSKLKTSLSGEIFICLDDAVAQARRFQTTWQSEVVRYLIHGLLHLHGFDDSDSISRRRMKREENRILREISQMFALRCLLPSKIKNRKSRI